ncbi:MAG TPA: hypothetical protein VFH43_13310 [Candidatus Kapabacteria bacterium]|nr:hypothetical protein [Candidatus Kapabacteria bacterium]
MKKKNSPGNKAALVATMLTVPMIATPGAIYAQRGEKISKETETKSTKNSYIKFADLQHKIGTKNVTILGVGDGNTIYEKPNGTKFYIDPSTGDMVTVSEMAWIKMTSSSRASSDMFLKIDGIKGESTVTLVGVDADGSVIHQKPDGTQFKVHQKSGHVTLLK